jgi:hypothetical protein
MRRMKFENGNGKADQKMYGEWRWMEDLSKENRINWKFYWGGLEEGICCIHRKFIGKKEDEAAKTHPK